MPKTKLCDKECPNEMSATIHIPQTGRYKKISIIKMCLPNIMYKVKLTYMKFTELLMRLYCNMRKKVNTHSVHPLS
jgi:hypothetical protein